MLDDCALWRYFPFFWAILIPRGRIFTASGKESVQPMICGLVDLGSNTIRLSIYQCENGQGRLLMHRKVMAGLADYVEAGALTAQGIQVACSAVEEYKQLMKNLNFHHLHVFATASLRNVSNTEDAAGRIQAVTGLPVDVLSGTEEARLSFLGAVEAGPESGLLIDLGGGSTELVRYEGREILSSCSLSLGSLSLFSRNVSALHPTGKERKAIRAQVKEQLESFGAYLSSAGKYFTLLFKVVGITWLCEFVAGICRDSGFSAIASQIELFGKIAILFVGMPVFLSLVETIAGFMG